jgi:hypothetical protein
LNRNGDLFSCVRNTPTGLEVFRGFGIILRYHFEE